MRLQDFPRSWARRCLGIETFCRETLGVDLGGQRLVLAYSTGLDSTALLYLLYALMPRTKLSLIAAHAHHGLRPDADAELEYARSICAGLKIPCETTHLDVLGEHRASGRGVEESARILRYDFLESVRAKYDADWIATAHHADDLAEDIVLRLMRGTGWPGLGGMAGMDPKRRLLRPILNWTKEELRAFALDCNLTWNEDCTNENTDPTRNRVRHHILPLMRQENPSFHHCAINLWQMARLDEDFWQNELAGTQSPLFLPHATLAACHPAKRLRLYKAILDKLGPGQVRSAHLFLLDQAWILRKTGTTIQFPGDKKAQVTSSGISFEQK